MSIMQKIQRPTMAITLVLSVVVFSFFINSYSVVKAATAPNLTIQNPDPIKGSVNLNWSAVGGTNEPWAYQLQETKDGSDVPQTIPSKSTVKVLNVYPPLQYGVDKGSSTFKGLDGKTYTLPNLAGLKKWMEASNPENSKGYGKGLITVDAVTLNDFKTNPGKYLKNSDGSWKYDVVFFGAADGNGAFNADGDINDSAEKMVESYLDTGRGVLFGHDTITLGYGQHPYFVKLAKYVNVVCSADESKIGRVGNTKVNIRKKGLLTTYPWQIGDIGRTLTVPYSHSLTQFASGDIWMQYSSDGRDINGGNPITSYNGKAGTNNFYLTSWNNAALIQTGHSAGKATADEQKALANTLFYLSQLTQETSFVDHTGQDVVAPDKPSFSKATRNGQKISVQGLTTKDNGSNYTYTVLATGQNSGTKLKSNSISVNQTSGFDKYVYQVNSIPTVKLAASDKTVTDASSFTVPTSDSYIHIAAVDKAGNVSDTLDIPVDQTAPTITFTTKVNGWTNQSVPYTVTFSDEGKLASGLQSTTDLIGNKKTDKLGGNQQVSNSIDKNGNYTATAVDNFGNKTETKLSVANIDKTIPISDSKNVANPQGDVFDDTAQTHEAKVKHILLKAVGDSPLKPSTLTVPNGVSNIKWSSDKKEVEFDWVVPDNGDYEIKVQNEAGATISNKYEISGLLPSPYLDVKTTTLSQSKVIDGKQIALNINNPLELGDPRNGKGANIVTKFNWLSDNNFIVKNKQNKLTTQNNEVLTKDDAYQIVIPANAYKGQYKGKISYELAK